MSLLRKSADTLRRVVLNRQCTGDMLRVSRSLAELSRQHQESSRVEGKGGRAAGWCWDQGMSFRPGQQVSHLFISGPLPGKRAGSAQCFLRSCLAPLTPKLSVFVVNTPPKKRSFLPKASWGEKSAQPFLMNKVIN